MVPGECQQGRPRCQRSAAANGFSRMTAPARRVWAALSIVYVVWGSTYFAIKVAVHTLPPLLTAGSRFLAAGVLLTLVLALRGHRLRITRRELLSSALVGLLLLTLGVGVVHVAETRIDSSVAAMIAGTVPLQVILMRTATGDRVSRAMRWGTVVGLTGLALVVLPGFGAGSTAVGLLVMVAASISWSVGSFFSPRLSLPRDSFVASAYEMLAGGVLLTAAALALGEWRGLGGGALRAESLAAWAYLVIVGSLIGFTAYAWLLRAAPISLVVTHQYVNPLVAIALGMLLLGERPSPFALAGALLVVGAVYVAVRSEGRGGSDEATVALPRRPRLPRRRVRNAEACGWCLAVLLHRLDRGSHLLVRADRHQVRDVVADATEAEHLLDGRRRGRPLDEPVLDHPVVVVELRQVRPTAIGKQHEHACIRAQLPRD